MISSRKHLLLLLPVLMLGGAIVMQSRLNADEYDPLRDYKSISLQRLIDQPSTFKNTNVKFKAYYHKIDDLWSPFYSPFDPDNYISFSVWPETSRLWVKEDAVRDFPFLFIKNDNGYLQTMLNTKKYALVQLKGTVTSAFNGYPWIEIRHFEILRSKAFNHDAIRTLIRAREAAQADTPTKATRFYEKALNNKSVSLTSSTRAQIQRELGINYFKSFEYKKALKAIKSYRQHTDEPDSTLSEIEEKADELLNMPDEERHQYERQQMKGPSKSSSYLPLPASIEPSKKQNGKLMRKYQTLLSSYRRMIEKNQSLENRNDRLKKRLNDVLQSRAKLQAKLRKDQGQNGRRAGSTISSRRRDARASRSRDRQQSDLRQRLIHRIRTLKRRNRSLRSRVSSLSRRVPDTEGQRSDVTANQAEPATGSSETASDPTNESSTSPSARGDSATGS